MCVANLMFALGPCFVIHHNRSFCNPGVKLAACTISHGDCFSSSKAESYAGGSDATGMASYARQIKGDDPDEKGYHGPPGWGLGVRVTVSHRKTYIY